MREAREIIDNYLMNNNGELNILGKLLKIILIILVIKTVISLANGIIEKTIRNKKESNYFSTNKRANTIREMLKKIVKYTLYFIGAMMILEMFNINTTSILATAGIGGLAIGFGAQSLVKDIITGFFILVEDQYAVGDYIETESLNGVVEYMGLRVTKLRDFSGELHIIPNGKIQIVTNKTRGAMRALVKVPVAYEENIDRVTSILEKVCREIKNSNDTILDGPNVIGISELGEYYLFINIVARTQPMEQWAIERQIRRKVKDAFDKENIKIPYPKWEIFGGINDDTKI